ncbi:MAG TPA: Gfo/Idh/MocA family oxidoreductase [Victivallales bacterium]|nr:Gfo/Idh/MocA family oxidoreductase [Victivallales bacterium]HPO90414.1 Gfo/Idh/MocA family oxidoreductase [Victivallales bacterium]HRR06163.1 Gfo/Idh/MocA family oxidoreductase [Victivallales bacterium]HRR29117.1 Gfo/Idh/MocA family oxidoreductase [Victivallales bacterium]HRU01303.1 Gfo/Idh/MocA family oxidoreductase [Victivallales bacterium]
MTKKTSILKKKLRVACIGAGGIAGAHLTEYAKMDDVEIVALADPVFDSMSKKAEQYKIPSENCFTDYRKMLEKIKPDAVSVCSPNGAHEENTIAALKAGAHVIVEKPMAMNAIQAEKMIEIAKKLKRKLVIGFQYRYDGRTSFIRDAVDNGNFGKILYAKVQALRRRGIPNWGVFGRKELQGGGPMIDIGVHCLEMCHYAMGCPKPVAAIGNCYTYIGNKPSNIKCQWPNWDWKTYNVEDLAVGMIKFDNGAMLSIEASFAAHIERDVWNFSIMGTKSGAQWDPPMLFSDQNNHMLNITPSFVPSTGWGGIWQAKMRNFVEHCLYDKKTLSPAEDGLAVQKILDAIYESSSKGGKEVQIK